MSWLEKFGLSPADVAAWKEQLMPGDTLLAWCIRNGKVSAEAYLNWASQCYGLPIVGDDFFRIPADPVMWMSIRGLARWTPHLFPLTQWENTLLIACLQPLGNLELKQSHRFVLVSAANLENYWNSLNPDKLFSPPPVEVSEADESSDAIELSASAEIEQEISEDTGEEPAAGYDLTSEPELLDGESLPEAVAEEANGAELVSLGETTNANVSITDEPSDAAPADVPEGFSSTTVAGDFLKNGFEAPEGFAPSFDGTASQTQAAMGDEPFADAAADVLDGAPAGFSLDLSDTPSAVSEENDLFKTKTGIVELNEASSAPEGFSLAAADSSDANEKATSTDIFASLKTNMGAKEDLPAHTMSFKIPTPETAEPAEAQVEVEEQPSVEAKVEPTVGAKAAQPAKAAAKPAEAAPAKPAAAAAAPAATPAAPKRPAASTGQVRSGAEKVPLAECKTTDEIAEQVLSSVTETFKGGGLILLGGEAGSALKPWKWTEQVASASNGDCPAVDLETPSIFRIVHKTRLPYHGYVKSSAINNRFFKAFGRDGVAPACVTVVPIIHEGRQLGMLMGFNDQEIYYKSCLTPMERLSDDLAFHLNRLKPAKAA